MLILTWTQGFITGLNVAQERLRPELGHNVMPDNEATWTQIITWCSTHPSGLLVGAAIEVFNNLPKAGAP